MKWEPLLALIDKALAARRLSADAASRESGHPDAIRNMRRKAEGKLKGGVTFDTVMDVARYLDISPEAVCRAAMGYSATTDDREAIRQEILREMRAELDHQIESAPASKIKRVSAR